MKKELLIILLLLILTFPSVKALLQTGAYTSHDLTYHVMRQISMDKLLTEGQFPPRWSGQLNNGYGYPIFIFNYQLPALIGEIFHKLGSNFVDSVKAVLFLSLAFSILGMYLFLRELLNSKLAAILGAIFYLYAPIRFINVYVSASVGASLAASILPLVFYFMVVLSKENLLAKGQSSSGRKNRPFKILLGGLSLGLLILSHNFTTLLFAPVILAFAGLLLWQSKNRVRVFKDFGGMFLLGLGISAWFWLPAVLEKQYLRFDQFYETFYQNQFITIAQLIHSPWGYGLSHPQKPESGDMSYQLGLAQILVIIVLGSWLVVGGKKIRELRVVGGFALIFFVLSIFMMNKVSLPVWESLPFLSIVQFPLRFSIIAVFCASIAAGLLIKHLPYNKILAVFLLFLVLYANRNHWKINEVFNPGDKYYLSLTGVTSPYGEDLPKWAKGMDKKSPGKFEFIKGVGEVRVVENKSARVLAEVEATTSAKIRFNQFYFPNWQIKVDDRLTAFDYKVEGESYGLPIFDIDSGKHQILSEFKNSPVRNIADAVSLVSVILWIILLCKLLILR